MQKSGDENMTVINSQGVRMAQCNAQFDVITSLKVEPTLNFSLVYMRSKYVFKLIF